MVGELGRGRRGRRRGDHPAAWISTCRLTRFTSPASATAIRRSSSRAWQRRAGSGCSSRGRPPTAWTAHPRLRSRRCGHLVGAAAIGAGRGRRRRLARAHRRSGSARRTCREETGRSARRARRSSRRCGRRCGDSPPDRCSTSPAVRRPRDGPPLRSIPKARYPIVRIGSLPYGLLPATAWTSWTPADGDPSFESTLVSGIVETADPARGKRARPGNRRRTRRPKSCSISSPTRRRRAGSASGSRGRWSCGGSPWLARACRNDGERWSAPGTVATDSPRISRLKPLRRYGAVGRSRRVGLPLVVPNGVDPSELPGLLRALGDAAITQPAAFANTAQLEANVLGGRGGSLLLRLAIRSLQLLDCGSRSSARASQILRSRTVLAERPPARPPRAADRVGDASGHRTANRRGAAAQRHRRGARRGSDGTAA